MNNQPNKAKKINSFSSTSSGQKVSAQFYSLEDDEDEEAEEKVDKTRSAERLTQSKFSPSRESIQKTEGKS